MTTNSNSLRRAISPDDGAKPEAGTPRCVPVSGSRSVPEWVGRSVDSVVPPRVRLRVFERDGGICQCGCRRRITVGEAWQTDHTVALTNGGENRETNLRTLLVEHHKAKTALDVKEKSKVARIRKRHLGIKKRRRTIGGRKFDGTPTPPRWVE